MIDKQIIDEMIEKIGFDVQQCGYLKIIKDALNYPEIGGTFTDFECNLYSKDCDFIEHCRYKQLLRKEQECEELKKQLERKEENYQKLLSKSNKYIHNLVDENVQDISNLAIQLDQLKTENEELRQFLSKEPLALQALQSAYASYKKSSEVWADIAIGYKQTLTKIKEIAEKTLNMVDYKTYFKRDNKSLKQECFKAIDQILQKISEVKNDNK